LPFTALLANADAAAFNLLRSGWFIPDDNNARIGDRTLRRCAQRQPLQGSWHQDQEGEMIFCAAPAK
jgi:hypothetical protein